MSQQESYARWPTNSKIPLVLSLSDGSGNGLVGASPQVSIRRYRESYGSALDGWYWNGTIFQSAPTWFTLPPMDPVNLPGVYTYLFEQDLVGLEIVYVVYYRNTVYPVGFAVEFHIITNEVYIPSVQPDPIILNPQTLMGQLELIKALLHHNGILDKQTYVAGQLTSARLRVFASDNQVPIVEGGIETAGLLAEFSIESAYDSFGLNKKFTLKRVFP